MLRTKKDDVGGGLNVHRPRCVEPTREVGIVVGRVVAVRLWRGRVRLIVGLKWDVHGKPTISGEHEANYYTPSLFVRSQYNGFEHLLGCTDIELRAPLE